MFLIPNNINIVWLGGFLREAHQERIICWRKLNPSYHVNLWVSRDMVDEGTYDRLNVFCSEQDISLCDVSSLHPLMERTTLAWLASLAAADIRNYGAISDLYRLYILKAVGGWYFDTDIIPLLSLPLDISLAYGFAVNIKDDTKQVVELSPSILVASEDSAFLDVAIKIINTFAQRDFSDKINPLINSKDALARRLSTEISTGAIVRLACGKLYVNSEPLFHVHDFEDTIIDHYHLFKKISIPCLVLNQYFKETRESSWLTDEMHNLQEGLENPRDLNLFSQSSSPHYPAYCEWIKSIKIEAWAKVEVFKLPSLTVELDVSTAHRVEGLPRTLVTQTGRSSLVSAGVSQRGMFKRSRETLDSSELSFGSAGVSVPKKAVVAGALDETNNDTCRPG